MQEQILLAYLPRSMALPLIATSRWLWIKLCVWAILWWLTIRIEFGTVFLICSAFYAIFASLGERREGELSAYSVFNKGMVALPGTFSAGEIDRSLRGGGVAHMDGDDD